MLTLISVNPRKGEANPENKLKAWIRKGPCLVLDISSLMGLCVKPGSLFITEGHHLYNIVH